MPIFIKYIIVFALATLPIIELRAAVPYGLFMHLSPALVFVFAVLGNMLPIPFIIQLLPKLKAFLFNHSKFLHRHVEKYFNKLHTAHSERVQKYGALALTIFTALPIPGTGAWTAAVLAYLFNIRTRYALLSIFIGVICAGLIMTFFSETVIRIFGTM